MKLYITKYALTQGILEVEGEIGVGQLGGMVTWLHENKYPVHAHGNDWHRTLPAAESRAIDMRNAKIKSLKKQIEKLDAMKTFKVVKQ